MVLSDRLLMGPGPSNPYPEVTAATTQPLLGHLDPAFLSVLDETCERLRTVFGTDAALTLPLSGTGSAGMEAAFANLVEPGDVVVVGVNGLFGQRMAEVADRCGAELVTVQAPWGEPLDPGAVLDAHPAPKLIAVVHAETSTGVANDVAAVAAGKGDAVVLADCVTSLAGMPVALDDWGVDVAYAGTQKCLGVPPGLAPFAMTTRAWERMVERCPSWYLDLRLIGGYVLAGGGRRYHHTAPTAAIVGLHAGLGTILDEGLEAGWERHRHVGQRLQDGLEKLGLELLVAEDHRLSQLTTVRIPDGVDDAAVRAELRDGFGIEMGGGAGELAGRTWRIGTMGHTARKANVDALLSALAEVLGR